MSNPIGVLFIYNQFITFTKSKIYKFKINSFRLFCLSFKSGLSFVKLQNYPTVISTETCSYQCYVSEGQDRCKDNPCIFLWKANLKHVKLLT